MEEKLKKEIIRMLEQSELGVVELNSIKSIISGYIKGKKDTNKH